MSRADGSRGQGLGKRADRASDETLCPDSQARVRSPIGYPARAAIHGSVPRIAGIHLALAAPVPRQCWKQRKQRSEEHTSELQSLRHLVCRLLLEKKK